MQNDHVAVGCARLVSSRFRAVGSFLIVALAGISPCLALGEPAIDIKRLLEAITAHVDEPVMRQVREGTFIMGTVRNSEGVFSLELQYDDTEQPQRRVWLDQYEIDRDEVSLGAYLLWLQHQQRATSGELRKLIEQTLAVEAPSPEILARWPALYVTWSEASDFCHTRGARLPTEAEWEKAARGDNGNLFPWGQSPPTPALAMFGQHQIGEIPIVVPVDTGEEGLSPYGLHHMAGNAAEWVEDWFGIDYYATMPDHNPRGPAHGRYKVVRGGSWKSGPALLRSATRSGASPDHRAATIGFRCARSVQ